VAIPVNVTQAPVLVPADTSGAPIRATQAPRLAVTDATGSLRVTQAVRIAVVEFGAPANLTHAPRLTVEATDHAPPRLTQLPRLAVIRPKTPVSILIDHIEHNIDARYTSVEITYQLGARGTAKLEVLDLDSFETAYRPQLDQRVEIFGTDGEPIFVGTIFGVTDTPLGAPGVGTVTAIDAVDDWVAAGMRRVTKTYADGTTLHTVVADLVTTYLAVYGIALDPLMGAGPALPAVTFDNVTLEEAFNQLVDLTSGWVYRLSPYKQIQWFPIGSHARDFTLSAANQNILGPIRWTKSRGQAANRIVVRYGTGLVGKQQLWFGDGVTLRFTPDYRPTFPAPASNGWIGWMNYVGGPFPGPPVPTVPPSYGGHEAIGVSAANNFPWWWDATTGELVRNIGAPIPHWAGGTTAQVPLVGDYFWIDYNVQFPLTVVAESPSALTFPIEAIVDRADIFDKAQAQAFADSLLAKYASTPRTVTLKTRAAEDFLPGDTVPMDVPARTLPNAEWLVTEVTIIVDLDQQITVTLSLLEGTTAQASWLDFWRDIAGGGASVGVASGSITPPPVGGGGGGGGTVANVMPLTLHALVVGEGDINVGALGDLGTPVKLLHGNPTGDPTFRPIDQTDLGGPVADGKVLTADASQPTGLAWGAGGGGTSADAIRPITFTINPGGVPTTGIKGDLSVPYPCRITGVRMLADQVGSAVLDILKDSYANYPPSTGDSIVGSAPPTLSGAQSSEDTTLAGWSTTLLAGDTLRFNLTSVATITRLTITLTVAIPATVVAPVATGSLILLETHVASGSASVNFTARNAPGVSGATFQSDYDAYFLELLGVMPATNTQDLRLRISTNGGATWDSTSNYHWAIHYTSNTGTEGQIHASPDTAVTLFSAIDNTFDGLSGRLHFFNPLAPGVRRSALIDVYGVQAALAYRGSGFFTWNQTPTINAVQIYAATGNLLKGTGRLYGIAK